MTYDYGINENWTDETCPLACCDKCSSFGSKCKDWVSQLMLQLEPLVLHSLRKKCSHHRETGAFLKACCYL
jgi:hypothetical protein